MHYLHNRNMKGEEGDGDYREGWVDSGSDSRATFACDVTDCMFQRSWVRGYNERLPLSVRFSFIAAFLAE